MGELTDSLRPNKDADSDDCDVDDDDSDDDIGTTFARSIDCGVVSFRLV